jgi:chromosomal replication initiator protein
MSVAGNLCAHGEPADAILAEVRRRIGPQKYDAWFRHGTRVSLEDGHVKVGAANPFIAHWIESHFAEELAQASREATGEDRPIHVGVDPSLSGSLRRRQLDSQAKLVQRDTDGGARRKPPKRAQSLRHRLDTFVVGDCNRLAYEAARTAIEQETPPFNPLFIHGSCGVGKTHLLQGICEAAGAQPRPIRWRYLTAEQFTNEFVVAIKAKRIDRFRRTYHDVDMLVIDDVHFLAAKQATQEEFLHTFNTIESAGRQVVMASDTHPRLLGRLTEQLISRFLSGMVVRIEPPDLDTRRRILRRAADRLGLRVSSDVLEYVAGQIRGSVRELEGTLVKVSALSQVARKPVDLQMARDALSEHLARTDSALTLGDIESVVSAFFGVTPAELHSSRRTQTVSLARTLVMYLARRHTRMSYPEIGRAMAKNHSSAVLAVNRAEKMLEEKSDCRWMTPAGPRTMPAAEIVSLLSSQLR